jgi:cytochrome P450
VQAAPVQIELLSAEFQNDPLPTLNYYREHQPVCQAADLPAYIFTRFADVQGMRDQTIYSTAVIRAMRSEIDGPNMVQFDGEEHARNRGLISPAFRAKVINGFAETEVVPIVEALLADLGSGDEVDLNPTFCEKIPLRSITRLLGLQVDREETISQLYRDQIAFNPLETTEDAYNRSINARDRLTELLTPAVDRVRADQKEGFLSTLLQSESKDGDTLSEEELFGFLRFLLPAGLETTMSSLSNALYHFLSRPDLVERLRNDPAALNPAIEESLRWHAPISYISRLTTQDTTVSGVEIPAMSVVLGSLNAANHDPRAFDEPDVFDPQRSPNKHIAFGVGVHACIGAPLARVTMRIAIPRLLERFPSIAIEPDFDPVFAGPIDNRLTRLDVRLGSPQTA